jgi:hypothetical protein
VVIAATATVAVVITGRAARGRRAPSRRRPSVAAGAAAPDAQAAALALAVWRADTDKGFLAAIDEQVAVLESVPVDLVGAAQVTAAVLGDVGVHVGEPVLGDIL